MSTTDGPPRRYHIAEVGRITGFTPSTLRFYENAGVLAPPARTDAGYRTYEDRDIERLRLISRAKELGCTLEEVAGLVQAWDTDECAPVKHQLRNLVVGKIAQVRDHIAGQVAFAAQLEATAAALAAQPVDGPCDIDCGCSTTTTADDPPPIACSLGAGDMDARVTEWQAVLAHVVARVPIPDGLRLTFGPNPPVAELTRLVAAEVSCCSFFTMAIGFDRHGVTLEVTAPVGGRPLLESLFGAAT